MTCQRWLWSSAAAVGVIATLSAQAPRPAFEVVSIKRQEGRLTNPPGPVQPQPALRAQFDRSNATVESLIRFAYDTTNFPVIGGPDWVRHDLFQISARVADAVSVDEMRVMVQALLADRFALVLRREQQEMRHYALVLARSDGRLGSTIATCDPDEPPPPPPVLPRIPGASAFVAVCAPVSLLVEVHLSRMLQALVIDRTGLTGTWRYEIVSAPPRLPPPGPARDALEQAGLPSFADAVETQLGMRLEPLTGPVEVLVIESVEQPEED